MRAFVCPTCKRTMFKAKGPWDVWYCLRCIYQWDVYDPEGPEPEQIDVDAIDIYSSWSERIYPMSDAAVTLFKNFTEQEKEEYESLLARRMYSSNGLTKEDEARFEKLVLKLERPAPEGRK